MSEKLLTDGYKIQIGESFDKVREALKNSGREEKVTLLAATKTLSAEVINYAAENLGLCYIGENRVQELLSKYDALRRDLLHIHFIGRLQRNKVKYIIDKVEMIESVDSMPLALEIDRQAAKCGRVMNILAEINIGAEESKGGVPKEKAREFVSSLEELKNINVCGLMVIPPVGNSEEYIKYFTETYNIFVDIFEKKVHNNKDGYVLSMGMSDSYIEAISYGSTLIRLGSALFGKRDYAYPDNSQ